MTRNFCNLLSNSWNSRGKYSFLLQSKREECTFFKLNFLDYVTHDMDNEKWANLTKKRNKKTLLTIFWVCFSLSFNILLWRASWKFFNKKFRLHEEICENKLPHPLRKNEAQKLTFHGRDKNEYAANKEKFTWKIFSTTENNKREIMKENHKSGSFLCYPSSLFVRGLDSKDPPFEKKKTTHDLTEKTMARARKRIKKKVSTTIIIIKQASQFSLFTS